MLQQHENEMKWHKYGVMCESQLEQHKDEKCEKKLIFVMLQQHLNETKQMELYVRIRWSSINMELSTRIQ